MTVEEPNTTEQGGPLKSNINRPWLVRIVVILLVLFGYGLWSVYDAFIAYPERGEKYASYAEWAYLEAAIEADRSESPGVLRRETKVADPEDELRRLTSNEVRTQNLADSQDGRRQKRAEMELARERWLTALDRINRLDPAYTDYEEDPRARFEQLNQRWSTETPPGPLQSYDIPVNKLAAVICFGFCIYLLYLWVTVATRTYTWHPGEKRLELPSGESLTPSDLEDVDKRKWDKFIVFLKVKQDHAQLGGKEIRFDTYRHGRLEEWLLEMEAAAFPDRVAEEKQKAEAAKAEADETERADAEEQPAGAGEDERA